MTYIARQSPGNIRTPFSLLRPHARALCPTQRLETTNSTPHSHMNHTLRQRRPFISKLVVRIPIGVSKPTHLHRVEPVTSFLFERTTDSRYFSTCRNIVRVSRTPKAQLSSHLGDFPLCTCWSKDRVYFMYLMTCGAMIPPGSRIKVACMKSHHASIRPSNVCFSRCSGSSWIFHSYIEMMV